MLDEDPWQDGALRARTREGLDALLLRFRATYPGIDTIAVPELG